MENNSTNLPFLGIDISVITFKGVSLSYQRKVAMVLTCTIPFGMAYLIYLATLNMEGGERMDYSVLLVFSSVLICYVAGIEYFMYTLAKKLLQVTPLCVLYRQDKIFLDRARTELIAISQQVNFENYLQYSKINPAICTTDTLLVVWHQRKGDLVEWTENVWNLKNLANFVYQIHLAEMILRRE